MSGVCVPAVSQRIPGGLRLGRRRAQLPCSFMSPVGRSERCPLHFPRTEVGVCSRDTVLSLPIIAGGAT